MSRRMFGCERRCVPVHLGGSNLRIFVIVTFANPGSFGASGVVSAVAQLGLFRRMQPAACTTLTQAEHLIYDCTLAYLYFALFETPVAKALKLEVSTQPQFS